MLWRCKMPLVAKPTHIFEPNPLACGQAVLSMLSGESYESIVEIVKTERETTLKDMKHALEVLGISCGTERVEVQNKTDLPPIALLSLETPKCWHWSLWFRGKFYDPEYGILENFPPSERRYYWEIST